MCEIDPTQTRSHSDSERDNFYLLVVGDKLNAQKRFVLE